MSGGGKGRKHGRNEKKPSAVRYKREQRWLTNKSKNIHREEMRKAAHKRKMERRARRRSNREEREAA